MYLFRDRGCSICSIGTAVSASIQPLLHVLQQSCSLVSMFRGNSCAMYFSVAVVCAPRKLLLHWSCSLCSAKDLLRVFQWNCSLWDSTCDPHVLHWSSCLPQRAACCSTTSTCSSRAAFCAPGKQLLHMLQWSCCMCSQQSCSTESCCSTGAALCALGRAE